jgi:hypothetical protein
MRFFTSVFAVSAFVVAALLVSISTQESGAGVQLLVLRYDTPFDIFLDGLLDILFSWM